MSKVDAVFFDLDNTLIGTDKLQEHRKAGGVITDDVITEKTVKYPKAVELVHRVKAQGIKIAIVTNSPERYAYKVLRFLGLDFFDAVITYDDVGPFGIKPDPKGIELAMNRLGLNKSSKILFVGDNSVDFNAAYAAGVKPVALPWGTGEPINQVPAAILNSISFMDELGTYEQIALIADRCAEGDTLNIKRKQLYFVPLNMDGQVVPFKRKDIEVICLGRYFSQRTLISASLHDRHKLSQEITKKDSMPKYVVPNYWVELFTDVANKLPEYLFGRGASFDYISVIPAKSKKNPRLENLLDRVFRNELCADTSSLKDLFYFSDGAQSLKKMGGAHQRTEEINRSLHVKDKHKEKIKGKSFLVFDDVITTGSTLKRARQLLLDLGASKVVFLCMAKTVNVTETRRDCPSCGNVLVLKLNHKTKVRFWGCSRYNSEGCKYSEHVKVDDCPSCGSDLIKKYSPIRKSHFIGCSNYPVCRHMAPFDGRWHE